MLLNAQLLLGRALPQHKLAGVERTQRRDFYCLLKLISVHYNMPRSAQISVLKISSGTFYSETNSKNFKTY